MPKGNRIIKSPNPDSEYMSEPGIPPYKTGADTRRGPIPMAFQVTSPFDPTRALLPHALVLHVNPATLSENHTKKIERIQTRGGFVEQHWPDDLSELSADGSTGAFMNLYTGTTSVLRQRTIAWDRFRDLYDLFHNNGSVYDPYGNIVLQGNIMLLYDRGTYLGYFKTFDYEETEESPFAFKMNWTFKIQQVIAQLPGYYIPKDDAVNGVRRARVVGNFPAPNFQSRNSLRSSTDPVKPAGQSPTGPTPGTPTSAPTGPTTAPPAIPVPPVTINPSNVFSAPQDTVAGLGLSSGGVPFGGKPAIIPATDNKFVKKLGK